MVSRQIPFLFALALIASNFGEEFPDLCSRFEGYFYDTALEECPQAKFMVKDNLFECYDKFYKEKQSKCKIVVSTLFSS